MTLSAHRSETDLASMIVHDGNAASVLWLRGSGEEIGHAIATASESLHAQSWMIQCKPSASPTDRRLSNRFDIPVDRRVELLLPESPSESEIVQIPADRLAEAWSWLFNGKQIQGLCAAFFPPGERFRGRSLDSGLLFSIATGTWHFRRTTGINWVASATFDAFLASVINEGGVSVSRAVPEMIGPVLALTGAPSMIDSVVAALPATTAMDPDDVRHSLELQGLWH